jgi:hypothetical protein
MLPLADASKIAKLAGCGGYREGSGYSKSGYYKEFIVVLHTNFVG